MHSPRLADIAASAKVSVMTVSLALRNDPRLPIATRERLQRLAQEMNYRANPLVSALMTTVRSGKRSRDRPVIAFLAANEILEYPTFREYLTGAEGRATDLGFKLDLFPYKDRDRSVSRLDAILRARGIVGVLVAPLHQPGCTIGIEWKNYAVAALGYSMPHPDLHRAANHQQHSMGLVLQKLTALGYARPGLAMRLSDDERVNHNWTASYLSDRFHRGDHSHPPPLLTNDWTEQTFMNWFRKFQPDVIITHETWTDIVDPTVAVTHWLSRAGVKIPKDVGLALVNREPTSGSIAGVDQDSASVGACGVELVAAQLYRNDRGLPENPRITLVKGHWVDGDTVRIQSAKSKPKASPRH